MLEKPGHALTENGEVVQGTFHAFNEEEMVELRTKLNQQLKASACGYLHGAPPTGGQKRG